MMFLQLSLFSFFLHAVTADNVPGNGNLTVAFFPSGQDTPCQANDISKGLVLTTDSLPNSYTCFNLGDIFSQPNNTGFTKNVQTVYDNHHNPIEPNGIYWLLHNKELYDSKANYSRVWYQQVNATGKAGEGQAAAWNFKVFPFADCKDVGGDDKPGNEWPWFENTCQTGANGTCRSMNHPVLSFSIASAEERIRSLGKCSTWAFRGGAAKGGPSSWVALWGSLLVTFLLL